ncbi:hypothetical protein L3X38_006119 [Prunus dulcis]|uniref:Uncharacterized protein n=1 Tax=Prunus dulcis TaxID=3755 RepID=A0AAD4ZSC2_PRUDU|nr:hypothetical protein L3X38_006119 [Prunus dulcis]
MPVTNSSLPKEEKLFLSWRTTVPCRSSSYQKVASGSHITRQKLFISEASVRVFLKTEAVFETQVEVYHLAQLLVMTLSSRFFTGTPRQTRAQCRRLTRLTNVITSGPHTTPPECSGTCVLSGNESREMR